MVTRRGHSTRPPDIGKCDGCFMAANLPLDDLANANSRRHGHYLSFPSEDSLLCHLEEQYAAYRPQAIGDIAGIIGWYRTKKRLINMERHAAGPEENATP